MQPVYLPYQPRPWQVTAHKGLRRPGVRTGLLICSRQIGKTWGALAELAERAMIAPEGTASCYLAPAATQARRIAWPRLKEYLSPLLLKQQVTFRETELFAELPGGRRIYCLGAESGDMIRGSSFRTIVCDERDSISDEFWRTVMLPTTNAHGDDSFILYIGTLGGGDSRLWRMYMEHRDDPSWYCQVTPGDASGVFTDEWLQLQRTRMGESAYRREILCDPTAPVENAVLANEMAEVERDGRVRDLPWRIGPQVYTAWDLGIRDFTAVWGFCLVGHWVHVMFYREFSGLGVDAVAARLLEEFGRQKVTWGSAWLPHDARARGKEFGLSVVDVIDDLWPGPVQAFQSAPPPIQTLQATRVGLQRCVFNARGTELGLLRLKSARYVVSPKTGTVTDTILHDDNSHGLDAFRYGMWRLEQLHGSRDPQPYKDHEFDGEWSLPARYFE